MTHPARHPSRFVLPALLLALLVFVLASGCKRRDDLADIFPDLGPGIEPHMSDSAPPDPPPAPAQPPLAQTPPPGLPAPDPAQALARVSALTSPATGENDAALHVVRIGAFWVAPSPAEPSPDIRVEGRSRPVLFSVPGTGLTLWAADGGELPPLCEAAPGPGEALWLVAMDEALLLSVRVARSAGALPAGAITGSGRLLVLDRPALPPLAGALLLDAGMRLCGLVTEIGHRGLMTAIGPEEIRLWQSPPDSWRERYPSPEPPQALALLDAPIQDPALPDAPAQTPTPPAETEQAPPTPDAPSPGWELPLAHAERWLGLTVQELTPSLRQAFDLDEADGGLLVTRVHPGSPAHAAGLQEADILQQIEETVVRRVEQLPPIMDALTPGRQTRLLLRRDGQRLTAELPIASRPGGPGGL